MFFIIIFTLYSVWNGMINYFKSIGVIGVTTEICLPLTLQPGIPSKSKNKSINKEKHSHLAVCLSMSYSWATSCKKYWLSSGINYLSLSQGRPDWQNRGSSFISEREPKSVSCTHCSCSVSWVTMWKQNCSS